MNKIKQWIWNPIKSVYDFWDMTLSNKGKLAVVIIIGIIIILVNYL